MKINSFDKNLQNDSEDIVRFQDTPNEDDKSDIEWIKQKLSESVNNEDNPNPKGGDMNASESVKEEQDEEIKKLDIDPKPPTNPLDKVFNTRNEIVENDNLNSDSYNEMRDKLFEETESHMKKSKAENKSVERALNIFMYVMFVAVMSVCLILSFYFLVNAEWAKMFGSCIFAVAVYGASYFISKNEFKQSGKRL